MTVTYTRLDGSTVTITPSFTVPVKVSVGNTAILTWSNVDAARASAYVTNMQSNSELTSSTINGVTYYYKVQNVTYNDNGLSLWASERLSPEDYAAYLIDQAEWKSYYDSHPDELLCVEGSKFSQWWDRFNSDPNLVNHP
jgi:hypothetical protein